MTAPSYKDFAAGYIKYLKEANFTNASATGSTSSKNSSGLSLYDSELDPHMNGFFSRRLRQQVAAAATEGLDIAWKKMRQRARKEIERTEILKKGIETGPFATPYHYLLFLTSKEGQRSMAGWTKPVKKKKRPQPKQQPHPPDRIYLNGKLCILNKTGVKNVNGVSVDDCKLTIEDPSVASPRPPKAAKHRSRRRPPKPKEKNWMGEKTPSAPPAPQPPKKPKPKVKHKHRRPHADPIAELLKSAVDEELTPTKPDVLGTPDSIEVTIPDLPPSARIKDDLAKVIQRAWRRRSRRKASKVSLARLQRAGRGALSRCSSGTLRTIDMSEQCARHAIEYDEQTTVFSMPTTSLLVKLGGCSVIETLNNEIERNGRRCPAPPVSIASILAPSEAIGRRRIATASTTGMETMSRHTITKCWQEGVRRIWGVMRQNKTATKTRVVAALETTWRKSICLSGYRGFVTMLQVAEEEAREVIETEMNQTITDCFMELKINLKSGFEVGFVMLAAAQQRGREELLVDAKVGLICIVEANRRAFYRMGTLQFLYKNYCGFHLFNEKQSRATIARIEANSFDALLGEYVKACEPSSTTTFPMEDRSVYEIVESMEDEESLRQSQASSDEGHGLGEAITIGAGNEEGNAEEECEENEEKSEEDGSNSTESDEFVICSESGESDTPLKTEYTL